MTRAVLWVLFAVLTSSAPGCDESGESVGDSNHAAVAATLEGIYTVTAYEVEASGCAGSFVEDTEASGNEKLAVVPSALSFAGVSSDVLQLGTCADEADCHMTYDGESVRLDDESWYISEYGSLPVRAQVYRAVGRFNDGPCQATVGWLEVTYNDEVLRVRYSQERAEYSAPECESDQIETFVPESAWTCMNQKRITAVDRQPL